MNDESNDRYLKSPDFKPSSEPEPLRIPEDPSDPEDRSMDRDFTVHESKYVSIENTDDGKEIPYDNRNYTHNIDRSSTGAELGETARSAARAGEGPGTPEPLRKDSPYRGYEIRSTGERLEPAGLPSGSPGRQGGGFRTFLLVFSGAILGAVIVLLIGFWLLSQVGMFSNSGWMQNRWMSGSSSSNLNISTRPEGSPTAENIIVERVTPSVVGITSRMAVPESEFFEEGTGYIEGMGSGVIVSADGYIVTNSHVVDGGKATEVKVILSDSTVKDGQVLWSDEALDLAILHIDATGLTPVDLGSAADVRVGDKAIAIGNPLGLNLRSTLTSGYISGLDRSILIEGGGSMTGLIQTDAAINEGNSGGALLNEAGQLIGINTAKAGGSASGIGFAIPIDTAFPIIDSIMTEGKFENVYMGLTGVDLTVARTYDTSLADIAGEGVLVAQIMPGTAAEAAGLKSGDIIVAIDGKSIKSMTDMKRLLLDYRLGDTVDVTYKRDGSEKTTKLTFAQDSSTIGNFSVPESATTTEP